MQLRGRITDESLKVGDIISQWARLTSRQSLGAPTDYMELQRHIVIEVFDNGVKTSVLYYCGQSRAEAHKPTEQTFISYVTLMAGYWRKDV